MRIHEIYNYIYTNIKRNPILSLVTFINCLIFVLSFISNARLDLYITTQQIKANADQIAQLSTTVTTDHSNILILQQIEKDNVVAQQGFNVQLQQLNQNLQEFELKQIK